MPKKQQQQQQQQQQKKSIYRGNGKRTVKRQFEECYDKKEGKRVYGATVGKLKRRAEGKA